MSGGFRILDHTADVGFEAFGETPEELFRQAARALLFIAVDSADLTDRGDWPVELTGPDHPSLLVIFLEELLYLFETGRFASCDCEVDEIEPTRIRATFRGEPCVPGRHRWKVIVKAVTYHGLAVTHDEMGWRARVFLDV